MQQKAQTKLSGENSIFHFLAGNDSSRLFSISEDSGSGRLTQGLMFLEIFSQAHRSGNKNFLKHLKETVPTDLIEMFENVESDDEKVDFVLKCLSCKRFYSRLKTACQKQDAEYDSKVILFRRVMVNIFDDVVSGNFERRKYNYLLPYIKKLILMIKKEI